MLLHNNDKLVRIVFISRATHQSVDLADLYDQAGGNPDCTPWERSEANHRVSTMISEWLDENDDVEIVGYLDHNCRHRIVNGKKERLCRRTRADKKARRHSTHRSPVEVVDITSAGRETKVKLRIQRNHPSNLKASRTEDDNVKILIRSLRSDQQTMALHLHPNEGSAHVKNIVAL